MQIEHQGLEWKSTWKDDHGRVTGVLQSAENAVSEGMGLSIAMLKREFDELTKLGVLVREGDKKSARWKILG